MSEPPSALLLRVRESDVVRMCGLTGAARGLDLASRRAVHGCRRAGSRLTAIVQISGDEEATPWAELRDEAVPAGMRWGCSCAAGMAHRATEVAEPGPGLGCEHVAAMLMAWIRHPADFATPAASAEPAPRRATTADGSAERSAPAGQPADARSAADGARTAARPALLEELQRLPDQELIAVARRVLGAEPAPETSRPTILRALGDALGDPRQVAQLLRRLDPAATELLRAVALLGGAITVAELDGIGRRSAAGRIPVEAAAAILRRHGLLFATPGHAHAPGPRHDREWRQLAGWHVPAEVRAALDHTLPIAPLPSTSGQGPPALPQALLPEEGRAPQHEAGRVRPAPIRLLCATLALLAHSPSPMRPGSPGAALPAAARRTGQGHPAPLPPVPGDPPLAVAATWARGARVPAGMALMARRVLLLALDAEGDGHPLLALDRLPPVEWPLALRAGFRLWLAAESHAELADLSIKQHRVRARCDPAHPGLRPATLAAETMSARRFVVELLTYTAGGAWFALDDLVDLVWRLDPFFLRGRQRAFDVPAWWLEGDATSRPLRAGVEEEWRQADGRFLSALLVGPLHWWGVVDLALDAAGTARAVRVAPMGAFLLGVAETAPDIAAALAAGWEPAVEPSRGGALAIHPLAAGPGLLDALAPWAQVSGVMGGRLVVQLSADLACRSLDAGRDPSGALTCLRALDTRDHTHAAPMVEQALAAWRARYGATRIESGWALLEADDEPALQETLRAVPGLADRCRVVATTAALVPAADLEALRATLNRRGFVV